MKLTAKSKVETWVRSKPGFDDNWNIRKLKAGEVFTVIGGTKYGIRTFYNIDGGGYVFAGDIYIIRDEEFYTKNFGTKTLNPRRVKKLEKGLSYSLSEDKQTTDFFMDLQLFALGGNNGILSGDYGFYQSPPYVPEQQRSSPTYEPSSSGTGIADAFGINDEYAQSALNGIGFEDLSNGQFLGKLAANLLDTLLGWGSSKLNYVVGFDFASSLFSRDGIEFNLWEAVKGGWSDLQGRSLSGNTMSSGYSGAIKSWAGGGNSVNGLEDAHSYWDDYRAMNHPRKISGTADSDFTGGGSAYRGDIVGGLDRQTGKVSNFVPFGSVNSGDISSGNVTFTSLSDTCKNYFSWYAYSGGNDNNVYEEVSKSVYAFPIKNFGMSGSAGGKGFIPRRPSEEVQYFDKIWGTSIREYKDALDNIHRQFSLNVTREDTFKKFNRYRLPTLDNVLTTSRGHIFFTCPDMNLALDKYLYAAYNSGGTGSSGRLRYAHAFPILKNLSTQHSLLAQFLSGGDSDHSFIPKLTDCCTGIDVADEVLETKVAFESFTGQNITYGTHTMKSKMGGQINVSFTDDNMLSVYKMFKAWVEYISAVSRGEASPKDKYMRLCVLDYAISIYYILCDATDENILFYTKYTGCFPLAAPSSAYADTGDPIKSPNYTVPFHYSKKDDYNPINLIEFNYISGDNFDSYVPAYNKELLHANPSFMGAPFVDTNTGGRLFKLKFRPAEGSSGGGSQFSTWDSSTGSVISTVSNFLSGL